MVFRFPVHMAEDETMKFIPVYAAPQDYLSICSGRAPDLAWSHRDLHPLFKLSIQSGSVEKSSFLSLGFLQISFGALRISK